LSYWHCEQALLESVPSGISRAPHEQPFQRPRGAGPRYEERRAGAAVTLDAGPCEQAVCLAGDPLLHSTLDPGTIRCEQQGQTDANLAVMIMADSVVMVVSRARTAAHNKQNSAHPDARNNKSTRGLI
jgi:hypothetical protein